MAIISKKKDLFKISGTLRDYLKKYQREANIPLTYESLRRYSNSIPLYDKEGNDTLWETVFYDQGDMEEVYYALKVIYSIMKTSGAMDVAGHLVIDRVDLCVFGNTQPFRVRIVNQINDNFDYFYIKHADASRIYGLELEHLLSPNEINYLVHDDTLIEEHIVGIPAEQFIKKHIEDPNLNQTRLAKEFVKFNERCFVRLLGDMHSSNFVIDVTPDFEDVDYRLRAIDFDQQSYEGRRAVYLPQYFKQNNPIIELGLNSMTTETVKQYRREERKMIANRVEVQSRRIKDLLSAMKTETLSRKEYVQKLRAELAEYYEEKGFLKCRNMGEIVTLSLEMLKVKPDLYKGH